MKFSDYDKRHYESVDVTTGYAEWSRTYHQHMDGRMDLDLLDRLAVSWSEAGAALDLACGTGRIGAWLRDHGVFEVDGVDLTPQMLDQARRSGKYRSLGIADIRRTGLAGDAYQVVTQSLACEHLEDLGPLYLEAARLLRSGGHFALVGYHPYFLMRGIPTHFDREDGTPLAIDNHIHLHSDHVAAGTAAGLMLTEMHERIVDDAWVAAVPNWVKHHLQPISFAMVWSKP